MQCVVTAGPTFEPLDRVRRLTNFSTGSLGTALANYLASVGHSVRLFRSETATASPPVAAVQVEPFTTTASLASLFLKHATDRPVAIFHAAAVSDFAFGPVYERDDEGRLSPVYAAKVSTRVGSLWVELKPTPKILGGLREWFPAGILVGWKHEMDGIQGDVLEKARRQMADCRTDACVANGPAHGPGYTVVDSNEERLCGDQEELLTTLGHWLERRNRGAGSPG